MNYITTTLTYIPDDSRIIFGALIVEGSVDQALKVVVRAPTEHEFGFGVVEPGRVIGCVDLDGPVAACLCEVAAHPAVIDWLVHADVEGLLTCVGVVEHQ